LNINYDDIDNPRGIAQHLIDIEIKAKQLGKSIPSLKKAFNDFDSIKLNNFYEALTGIDKVLRTLGKSGLDVKNILTTYSNIDFDNLEVRILDVKRELQTSI
jgi:hypothetical protein